MIKADIPAVLALDERCLGGLWTRSGYERELDSEYSDVLVLVKARSEELFDQRLSQECSQSIAAVEPTCLNSLSLDNSNSSDANAQSEKEGEGRANSIELLGIGCLWAVLEEAHITTLAVEPRYQRKKLGLLLLTQLLLKAYDRGLTRATLEVRLSNQRARSLYQKFDFKEAGERKRYYADGENARILWCSGLQTEDCLAQINYYQSQSIKHLGETQNYRFYRDCSHTQSKA
ncbi:MAG: GNAT family N-acetyltransferase [Cyanobacteria bacterium P01_D01_bin.1]